jgi:hypothetical protein
MNGLEELRNELKEQRKRKRASDLDDGSEWTAIQNQIRTRGESNNMHESKDRMIEITNRLAPSVRNKTSGPEPKITKIDFFRFFNVVTRSIHHQTTEYSTKKSCFSGNAAGERRSGGI